MGRRESKGVSLAAAALQHGAQEQRPHHVQERVPTASEEASASTVRGGEARRQRQGTGHTWRAKTRACE